VNGKESLATEFSTDDLDLLTYLLAEEGVELTRTIPLRRRTDLEKLPLSYAQQRLWFLEQMEPGSAIYNVPQALRVNGELAVEVLEASLREVIRRHEVLRTRFALRDGEAEQVIEEQVEFNLVVEDLSELQREAAERAVQELARAEAQQGFDLGTGPMLRAKLLRLDANEHVLLLTMHHIVSDGWSLGVLVKEIGTLYQAYAQGASSPLPELPVQYADYAVWQREYLQGEVLEQQLSYWRAQLAGAAPVLELPTDRPRPQYQTFNGSVLSLGLPVELSDNLMVLSRREGATLFMTLLAAFDVLLWRYTGQTDLSVGTPIAGRNHAEVEGLIGFFINTLVLRVQMDGRESFRELLGRVREATLGAFGHQDVPFERLVEELQPDRDLSHTPLFQVGFVLQNVPHEQMELQGLSLSPESSDNQTSKYDLTLRMYEMDPGLSASVEYNSDLFERSTMTRLLDHFQTLLESISANPDLQISKLNWLPETERREILKKSNVSAADYRRDVCLHQWFETQVERTPEAPAVTYDGATITYKDLNQRANQLAHYLRKLGIGADSRVAICVERSLELVIGIMSILKAGGAYVPLDPALPTERLSFMLSDSEIQVLLTQESLIQNLPDFAGEIVRLDHDWQLIESESTGNPGVKVLPGNAAYVIHTSGSTGKPKGVVITHANVVRLFEATREWFNFGATDVWTLFHSYAFDFSVWELWGALLYGGRLVVVPYLVSRTPEAFYDLLCREQVTVLNQTPSAFRQLISACESADGEQSLSLRFVVFGGEALELQSLQPWFDRWGDERPQLVNMYGITETTVHVTYRPLTADDLRQVRGSMVGQGIPDLQVYVLDEEMQLVPFGVAGELYVGGDGLARGYLNRAGLTAERFVPNPFGDSAGARLYKTGDKARYLANGDIEYLGRLDQQVKIRGHRIELGEIEAVLSGHESVREVAVIAKQEESGDQRLAAYVSLRDDLSVDDLRSYMRRRLPEYMVPATFVMLDQLPLTTNGKVNRQALPDPAQARPHLDQPYVAPRTAVEEILAAVWASVLGVEEIGVHDNYFTLGGDSIRSVQLLALARERGLEISLQQLFRHQNIDALAREIKLKEIDSLDATRVEPFTLISESDRSQLPATVEDAYPLTMLQMGMFYHMELMPDAPLYHNVNSWPLEIPFNHEAFQEAVDSVLARHAIFRTSFDLTSYSEPLQLVHSAAPLRVPVVDLLHLSCDEQNKVLDDFVKSETQRAFDLSSPPLLRFHFHLLTDKTVQFTLTECHAILDGWSLTSTLAEIFTHYFALLHNEAPPAPAPPAFLFRDFVRLERLALESEECRQYWDDKLRGSKPVKLPRLHDQNRVPYESRIRTIRVPISSQLNQGLRRVARIAKVPIKSVLLAAHLKVLSLLSGRSDVMGGLLCNGRPEESDGAQVRGLFLNAVPLRLQLEDGNWLDLVRQAFEAEWELLPYRRYPLSAMQRKAGGQPLFETQFNYVHFHALSGVLTSGEVAVQATGIRRAEETQFTLATAFTSDVVSSTLDLVLEFDMRELSAEQTDAIASYYALTLDAIAGDPLASHNEAALLPAQEQSRLLLEWTNTGAHYPETCLHELFEAQVERTPDAIAVVYEDQQLSYRELNEQGNQLAHYLRKLGVGPEKTVGVLMERSLEMVIGLLGILKAGGAYVPFDTAYPKERLAFMLDDSQVTFLLGQKRLADKLPPHAARFICLETDWEAIVAESKTNPLHVTTPESLLYVLYTSGSTGKPKGALLPHRGIVNCIHWMQQTYQLTPSDRFLFKTSLNFDPSVWEVFWPLTVGAAVVTSRPGADQDAAYLVDCVIKHGVTGIYFVPSMLNLLLDESRLREASSLRFVICGGESLARETVERFCELSDAELHHSYGPTETSIAVTESICARGQRGPVPIGRPLANTRVYVLDKHLHPVPIGVPGELYVGGHGLARGYLQRPELTAERFVPDPFSSEPGSRLYVTGDQVRYWPDGNLEFLGRTDDQVKVRGFRIELGEIVAALDQHAAVREAIVVAGHDSAGTHRLAAYILRNEAAAASHSELRSFLETKLPKYMVPSAFVFLESWPLMANGKIDRHALPQPESVRPQSEIPYLAPRTELERIIASLWQEVLQIEMVGTNDNFFDLGGHSLSMLQVHNKLRQYLNRPISMVDMFQYPTVSSMSKYLSQEQDEEVSADQIHVRTDFRQQSALRQRQLRKSARNS
jgi:amino acid adenylation domain-containing protein